MIYFTLYSVIHYTELYVRKKIIFIRDLRNHITNFTDILNYLS